MVLTLAQACHVGQADRVYVGLDKEERERESHVDLSHDSKHDQSQQVSLAAQEGVKLGTSQVLVSVDRAP